MRAKSRVTSKLLGNEERQGLNKEAALALDSAAKGRRKAGLVRICGR